MSVRAATEVLAALRELSFAALCGARAWATDGRVGALERLPVPWCDRRLDETRRIQGGALRSPLPRWPLLKGVERLSERQAAKLAELVARFPAIAEQHWCKERLRELYRSADRRTAEARWTSLLVAIEASEDPTVWAWARTLRSWRREIMGFFEVRITNGFTEGCHTKVKLLKRLSYGYRNVEVYRRKMLLGFLPVSPTVLAPHLSS